MLGLAFSGCNAIAAIVFSAVATGMSGAVSTGPLASFIDISPNFASEFHNLLIEIPFYTNHLLTKILIHLCRHNSIEE